MSKDLDIVVFGASGYTGKLVVEYLKNEYGENGSLKWAIAGRDETKLTAVKEELSLGNDLETVIVESDDLDSLDLMTNATKCVLTTVGPYQLYGSKLVESCARNGTDYVDLTGEPGWMYEMISAHSKEAKESGSRIVFSCGFDSIPFDLGVYFLQKNMQKKYGKTSNKIRGRVKAMNGEFSGGTAASMKATMAALQSNPELINILVNPHALCDGMQGVQQDDDSKPVYDEELDTWVAPFFMAPINTKNIHRSNKLMNHIYGENFKYNEMWIQGPGEEGKAAAEFISTMNPLGDAPEPGDGPSRESRENGNYDVLFCADVDGETIKASVSGDMDPGYGSTSKMITESAVCLVKDCENLAGGIYTPAASMGKKLIKRLESSAGLTFKLE